MNVVQLTDYDRLNKPRQAQKRMLPFLTAHTHLVEDERLLVVDVHALVVLIEWHRHSLFLLQRLQKCLREQAMTALAFRFFVRHGRAHDGDTVLVVREITCHLFGRRFESQLRKLIAFAETRGMAGVEHQEHLLSGYDNSSTDQANYNGNVTYGKGKKGQNRAKTTPVGSFPANAWGLHDMYGNVLQWCQHWIEEYPRKDVIDPHRPDEGQHHVLRGGSWFDEPRRCRSAFRTEFGSGIRGDINGFRLCVFLD